MTLLSPETYNRVRSCNCSLRISLSPDKFLLRDSVLSCPHCGLDIDAVRCSPSRISALCVPDFCPRCFYLLINLKFAKPFDFGTPFIMQLLDQHQKRVAEFALREDGELPKFFGVFREAIKVIDLGRLWCYDPATNIELAGYTDLAFDLSNATLGILDDKTALAKTEKDPLFHAYRAQVCCYKFMAEHGPVGREVSKLGLLYYEFAKLGSRDSGRIVLLNDAGAAFPLPH